MVDYLPNTELKSNIVNHSGFARLWGMFPAYAKIRVPNLIFRASVDGYNIHTLYDKCGDYYDSFYNCIIIILTKDKGIFGCYLD